MKAMLIIQALAAKPTRRIRRLAGSKTLKLDFPGASAFLKSKGMLVSISDEAHLPEKSGSHFTNI
jgi:hypothetical protein